MYGYIKEELIKKGVPEDEICFIHDAKTDLHKKEMFADMRSGRKRIIIGSTAKMGVGTNLQDRLTDMHDLDCPWKPSDLEQRAGRIIRQGNQNKEVGIHRYVTENTFDGYLWQIVEQKQKFISQIMTSKSVSRTCEDIDETVLSFAEIKAIATGNPLIKEKMNIDNEVARLKLLKADYNNQRYSLQDDFTFKYPKLIQTAKSSIDGIMNDIETRNMANGKDFIVTLNGKNYNDKELAGTVLKELCRHIEVSGEEKKLGSYLGFEIIANKEIMTGIYRITLHHSAKHTFELGDSGIGNIQRMENTLVGLEHKIELLDVKIEEYERNMEESSIQYEKPFSYEEELTDKLKRQFEINSALDLDKTEDTIIGEEENEKEKEEIQEDYENDY